LAKIPKIGVFAGNSPKKGFLALFGPFEGLFYINPSRRGPAVPAGHPAGDRPGGAPIGARGGSPPPSRGGSQALAARATGSGKVHLANISVG